MEILTRAQAELGLSKPDMCRMLGLQRVRSIDDWEKGRRQMDDARVRLLQAYLDGYRPDDWPAHEGQELLTPNFRAFSGDVEIEYALELSPDWSVIDINDDVHQVDRVILRDGRVITKPECDVGPRSILSEHQDANK